MSSRLLIRFCKPVLLLVIPLLLMPGHTVSQSLCAAQSLGRVGWWPRDANGNDFSGLGNNGTLQKGVTFALGRVGQWFSLNGAGNCDVSIHEAPVVRVAQPRMTDVDEPSLGMIEKMLEREVARVTDKQALSLPREVLMRVIVDRLAAERLRAAESRGAGAAIAKVERVVHEVVAQQTLRSQGRATAPPPTPSIVVRPSVIPAGERQVLLDLYNNTNGATWNNNPGWGGVPGTECTWYGVICDGVQSTVQQLRLENNNLTGTLPTTLGNLTGLQRLLLDNNHLTGSIPTQLGNLTNLWDLELWSNQLTGSIPPQLGNLTSLTTLDLETNALTGAIPTQLGNLKMVVLIDLNSNQLTGSIPTQLGNLTTLLYLKLGGNQLTGSIPTVLGSLTNLQWLDLSSNQLSGAIPTELGNLANMNEIFLNNNQLTGSIPTELGNLTNLMYLDLSSNQLSGSIPTEFGNLTNLWRLTLNSNQLVGPIPSSITNLTQLLFNCDSDLRWNGLYSSDPAVVTFFNTVSLASGGDWQSTQTVSVTDLTPGVATASSVALTWTPITYTGDTGGYEVFFATISGGPYTLFGTTADKSATGLTVTGLNPATTYYFIVKSVTKPHANNQNTVVSDPTPEVSAKTATLTVVAPPTIIKAFGAAEVPLDSSISLSFTIKNPNTSVKLTGIGFADTLPAGLVISTPNELTGSCGGGTIKAPQNTSVVSLSGATLAGSGSCSFSVDVTGRKAGVKNNSVAVSSNEGGTGNTSNASVTVVAPPMISKVFGAASIPLNSSTSLSFTIQNTNTTTTLTGIGFTDTLPAGLVISTPNGLTGNCGGGTIRATQNTSVVSLSGASLAHSSSCTFVVNVTGTTAGTKNNKTETITSTEGSTGGTASDSIAVVAAATISKAFGAAIIPLNGTTSLTITLTNPSVNTVPEMGVSFSDTLPTGLAVATPNALTNTCGGAVTATAGSGNIMLTGATVTLRSSCTVSVNVKGTTAGVKNNTTGVVSSTNGGAGATSNTATLTVELADLFIAKGALPTVGLVGTNVVYTVMVTNLGPTTATGVSWTDPLPAGATFVSINGPAGWACSVMAGVVTCAKAAAMAVNELDVFTLTVTLNCGQADKAQINNTATVTFPGTDPVPGNNTATAAVAVSNPPATLVPASAAYRSRGGTGSVAVVPTSTCGWSAASDAAFLTITSGSVGTGAGPVNYTVATNPGSTTHTGILTIAGQTFTVTETAVTGDNSQTTCLNVPGDGAGSASTPGSAQTVETGYAQVQSCSSKTVELDAALTQVYGTAVFSLTQNNAIVSEAGVSASSPTTSARIFVDFRTNLQAKSDEYDAGLISVNTGIAIVNMGGATATLIFTLRDGAGATLATGQSTLPAGNHRALFIDQLNQWAADFAFPLNFATAVQYGTLTITSDQAVAVIALRSTFNQRGETLLTTTPIADLTKAPGSGPLYFPQLADGGAFTTTLILMNTSAATETGKINLFRNDGTGLQVHRLGDAPGTASTLSYSIAAGGVYKLETDGAPGSVNTGSVQVVPDAGTTAPVGAGLLRFAPLGSLFNSQIVVTESGVPAATPTTHALVYVDQSNGHMTGVAIAAPDATPVHVTLRALQSDGVTVAGLGSLNLVGNGHDARFVQEFIAGLPAGFTGVLEIMAPTPVAVLTLRALVNIRKEMLLTTFPVADFNQPAPGLLFPQIADGGGFVTQIILLNTGPALQRVRILYFGDDGQPLDVAK